MCNTDDLFFRFYNIITNQIDQSIQGCFTSTDIFISYNIAIFVSSENRLDFENISDSGYTSLDTSGAGKVFKISDSKDTIHLADKGFYRIGDFIDGHAFVTHNTCIDGKKSLSKRCVERIYQSYFAAGCVLA